MSNAFPRLTTFLQDSSIKSNAEAVECISRLLQYCETLLYRLRVHLFFPETLLMREHVLYSHNRYLHSTLRYELIFSQCIPRGATTVGVIYLVEKRYFFLGLVGFVSSFGAHRSLGPGPARTSLRCISRNIVTRFPHLSFLFKLDVCRESHEGLNSEQTAVSTVSCTLEAVKRRWAAIGT